MLDANDLLELGARQIGMSNLQKGLVNPIKNAQTFLGRLDRIGQTFLPKKQPSNEYARQNVLQEIQKRRDPVLSIDWIGIIQDPPGMKNSPQMPWAYIDEIQCSPISISPNAVFRNGIQQKYAGNYDVGSASLKLYTDVSGMSFNYANAWIRSIRRNDGQWGLPASYKKDIVVYILDSTREVVVDIRLVGCYPTSWQSYSLEATSASPLFTLLELSVDDFYINVEASPTAAKNALSRFLAPITGALDSVSNKVSSVMGNISKTDTFIKQVKSIL